MPKKRKPSAPLVPLTGKQKSFLRSLAHKLKPVVQIGHQGVTEGVVAALDAALERHELIKVKVAGEAEVDAQELGPVLEKATRSQVAQIIGHTLVLYRRHPEEAKIVLPTAKKAKAGAAKLAAAPRAGAAPERAYGTESLPDDEDDDLDDDDELDEDDDLDEDDEDELE